MIGNEHARRFQLADVIYASQLESKPHGFQRFENPIAASAPFEIIVRPAPSLRTGSINVPKKPAVEAAGRKSAIAPRQATWRRLVGVLAGEYFVGGSKFFTRHGEFVALESPFWYAAAPFFPA
jgi:hypothetical protein